MFSEACCLRLLIPFPNFNIIQTRNQQFLCGELLLTYKNIKTYQETYQRTSINQDFFRLEWQKYANIMKVQGKNRTHRFDRNKKSKKKKLKKAHKRRSVSLPRFVEALVVADSTMMEYHNEGDVETYLLTIMNMVNIHITQNSGKSGCSQDLPKKTPKTN